MSRRRAPVAPPQVGVIYLRVSTREQARDGVGLDAQEARCRAACEARGLTVASVYRDEGISGRSELTHRPGLAKAIAEVRAAPGAILVAYSISRIARSQRVLWSLIDPAKDKALPVLSATEPFDTSTPTGRAMLGMIGVWSQLEADIISERTRDAMAALKASGKRIGAPDMSAKAPELVERIAQLRDRGLSIRAIADKLNADGVPGLRGGKWWTKNVRSALAQSLRGS